MSLRRRKRKKSEKRAGKQRAKVSAGRTWRVPTVVGVLNRANKREERNKRTLPDKCPISSRILIVMLERK